MGFLDDLIDLPGKVIGTGAEIVTRLPEVPIKIVKEVVKGVEKGMDKIDDILD